MIHLDPNPPPDWTGMWAGIAVTLLWLVISTGIVWQLLRWGWWGG